jgi:hypothetical protein
MADQMSATGLDGFLRWWTIDSVPPARFAQACRPFQIDRMQKIAPAIEQVAGFGSYSGPRGFWNICSRGYDKSGSIARTVVWAVSYSRNPIEIVLAAGDKEQASIIYDAAKRECDLNPWIKGRIHFKMGRITGLTSGSTVKVLTADAPSSYGLRPDLIVCDEITWWDSQDLWHSLFTARQKRPNCALIIISNAGVLKTWQHELYTNARLDKRWMVWETDPKANPTWMSAEDIEADKKLLPRAISKRLYDNLWIDPGEESGYLLRSEIEPCVRSDWERHFRQERGCAYAIGVDYGPKKDRTVLSLLHQDENGQTFIDEITVFQGSIDSPVQISRVEEWLDEKLEKFPQAGIMADPYQMESTVQRYESRCRITRFQARGPVGNYRMAELLRDAIVNRRIQWFPGEGRHPYKPEDDFTEELANLIIKELPGRKYRFDHELNSHDDRAVSVGMALVALHEGYLPSSLLVPPSLQPQSRQLDNKIFAGFAQRPLFGMDMDKTAR